MTDHSSTEFTQDELLQAFKSIEIAYSAKLKERGDPSGMFAHCKSVLRQFKAQFPSAPLVRICWDQASIGTKAVTTNESFINAALQGDLKQVTE
ncbi:MAG: hypothetical protein ABJL67_16095 [Sulfitobacter sp.]